VFITILHLKRIETKNNNNKKKTLSMDYNHHGISTDQCEGTKAVDNLVNYFANDNTWDMCL
jgi:hypothetical protein